MANPDFPLLCPQWQETTQGTFERGWDPIEKMTNQLGKIGVHDLICFKVKLSIGGKDLVEAARKSWIALRYKHPSIASKVDDTRQCFLYSSLTDNDLKTWLTSSFHVNEEVDADTYISNGDIPTVKLTVFPKTSELIYQIPHLYGDGPGGVKLMAELIGNLSNPPTVEFGPEAENLNIALTTHLGMKETTPEDKARCKQLEDFVSKHKPSLGLPRNTTPSIPEGANSLRTLRRVHNFTTSETEKIIAACKTAGLTATHVFHAAIIRATQELAPTKHEKFSENAILSWSQKASADNKPRTQGFGSSLLVCAFPFYVAPGSKSLLEIAKEVKTSYTTLRDDESLPGAYPPYYLGRYEVLKNPPKEVLPSATPLLSSWGVLEKLLPRRIGEIDVLDFGFGIEASSPNSPMTTFLWTFRDRMCFSITTKEYYTSTEIVDKFVELVVEGVKEGLEIGGEES